MWTVTRLEPEAGSVEMVKIAPEATASILRIVVEPAPGGSAATVTYSHTSRGPRGDEFVTAFTEEFYTGFMGDWERRLNHYLQTGQRLHLSLR